MNPSSLARALDDEFRRTAKADDIRMEELVAEIARLTGYSTRQLYNFRAGKWAIPASLIPLLVRRFRSRALIHALMAECDEVEVPEQYDLARLSSQAVVQTLRHYEQYLTAFEDGRITLPELRELEESSDRLLTMVHTFREIARADYARRSGSRV